MSTFKAVLLKGKIHLKDDRTSNINNCLSPSVKLLD